MFYRHCRYDSVADRKGSGIDIHQGVSQEDARSCRGRKFVVQILSQRKSVNVEHSAASRTST